MTLTDRILSEIRSFPGLTATELARKLHAKPASVAGICHHLTFRHKVVRTQRAGFRRGYEYGLA